MYDLFQIFTLSSKAVIIYNDVHGPAVTMNGNADSVSIPVVMIELDEGLSIVNEPQVN